MQLLATPMPVPASAVAASIDLKASSRISSLASLGATASAGSSPTTAKSSLFDQPSAGSLSAANSTAIGAATDSQNQAPVLQRTVTLASNSQFNEVMQETLQQTPMITPQRISIELQTPPGEAVTVFFSQANGQLRAQLSASDSGSMQWLQQQIGSLRENGSGPSVVWLPPQLDSRQQDGGQQGQGGSRQQQNQNSNHDSSSEPTAEETSLADALFGAASALSNN